MNGDSYARKLKQQRKTSVSVPSREETGVSNMMMLLISFKLSNVSAPSHGDWGFLQDFLFLKMNNFSVSVPSRGEWGSCRKSISGKMALPKAFPSPFEVTEGSYFE